MREINKSGKCKRCGVKLPDHARSDMLYCGTNCRVGKHRNDKGDQRRKYECNCHWCGKRFEAVSYWRSYCPGNACKQAAYRARKAAGQQLMF